MKEYATSNARFDYEPILRPHFCVEGSLPRYKKKLPLADENEVDQSPRRAVVLSLDHFTDSLVGPFKTNGEKAR